MNENRDENTEMKQSLFEYENYKEYLRDWIQSHPKGGHGLKSKLAAAMGCNTTYVSQMLHGAGHLSLEQAEKASKWMGHSESEVIFFLLLLQLARAGTESLQLLVRKQILQAVESQLALRNRIQVDQTLSAEAQATYYSAWYYAAIHVVLSMCKLQTKEALARYFSLPLETVAEALHFLTSVGLAVVERNRYHVGKVNVFLDKDSPMVLKHHANWRLRALDAMDRRHPPGLHYSSVITISQKDRPRIQALLIKAIEEIRVIVKESPEEDAYCYALDFFGLNRHL